MAVTELHIRSRLALFYSPAEVEQWMSSPQTRLGGKSAQELIAAGQIDQVDRLLRQLEDGVFI